MTFPHSPQPDPGPRPGPPPGGFRPGPPPPGYRPMPRPQPPATPTDADTDEYAEPEEQPRPVTRTDGESTGHPAVDAVLRSLANAAQLAPAEQIAEYEAAHRVLQETLSSIDS